MASMLLAQLTPPSSIVTVTFLLDISLLVEAMTSTKLIFTYGQPLLC